MKNPVFLEYMFVFDPAEGWAHLYEFESMFANYLKTIGFEGEVVKRVDGQSGRGMIFITKKQAILVEEKLPVGRPPSIGTTMRNIAPEKKVRAAERNFKNRAK